MNSRLIITLAAAVLAAIVALGCGSGGGDGSSSPSSESAAATQAPPVKTSSLSKATFITRASAICNQERQAGLKEMNAYLERQAGKGLPEAVLVSNAFKAVLLPTLESEIASIRKLGAPAGDEEEIGAILAAQQAAVDEVKEQKKVGSTEAFERYFTEANKKFQDYGFRACATSQ